MHDYQVALAGSEEAMPFGGEAAHLGAVAEEDEVVGVVVDEGVGGVDRDVEEAVDDVIGLPYPTLLGVGAGEDEEEEE